MPRNTGGVYTLPPGNPVTTGTLISTVWANGTMNDLANEMQGSLSRNGYGGMLAALKLVQGSQVLPSLTFGTDTGTGLWLMEPGELGITCNLSYVASFASDEIHFNTAVLVDTGGLSVAGGLTVSSGGASILGGVTANGATSNGAGGTFTGGTTNGRGVVAQGSGTGVGVYANGGGGTVAIPTEGNSAGGVFISNQLGAPGCFGWGTDTGAGVYGRGGTTGPGVFGTGVVGGRFAASTAATGSAPTNALEVTNGNIKLSGVAPDKNVSVGNVVTPINVVKAWASISIAASTGAATFNDGFNVTSVSNPDSITKAITVTFGTDMATDKYAVYGSADWDGSSNYRTIAVRSRSAGAVDIVVLAANTGTPLNFPGPAAELNIAVVGRQ
jgi:hypothetical protein